MNFQQAILVLMIAYLPGMVLAQMVVREGNNEFMRVTRAGRVGIGTALPSTQLHTTGGVRFAGVSGTNSNTTVLTVDGNGNVNSRPLPSDIWDDNANIRTQTWGTSGYQSNYRNKWDGSTWHKYDNGTWNAQISYAVATKTHDYFAILTENRVASGGNASYRCKFTLQKWNGSSWENASSQVLDTQRSITGGGYINWTAAQEWNVSSMNNGSLLRVYIEPIAGGSINGDDCQCSAVFGVHSNQSGMLPGAAFN